MGGSAFSLGSGPAGVGAAAPRLRRTTRSPTCPNPSLSLPLRPSPFSDHSFIFIGGCTQWGTVGQGTAPVIGFFGACQANGYGTVTGAAGDCARLGRSPANGKLKQTADVINALWCVKGSVWRVGRPSKRIGSLGRALNYGAGEDSDIMDHQQI